MGHPGLLIQDYVAGIPIWYNPNKGARLDGRPAAGAVVWTVSSRCLDGKSAENMVVRAAQ
jgi:hypothetical protein